MVTESRSQQRLDSDGPSPKVTDCIHTFEDIKSLEPGSIGKREAQRSDEERMLKF